MSQDQPLVLDAAAYAACFTPDARMVEEVFDDPDIWEGHDGIRGIAEHYRNAPGFPGRQQRVDHKSWERRHGLREAG